MWVDWGPAQRTNLYATPEKWVVAIGGGGGATIVDVSDGNAPRLVTRAETKMTRSEDWTYLGAVDSTAAGFRFVSPEEMRECIDLFGAGSSPYRIAHQAPTSCR